MPSLDKTMGCLLIATIAGGMLWGVSCAQLLHYFTRYHKDSKFLKIYVSLVFIFDSVQQAVIIQSVYEFLITGFGDPTKLAHSTKPLTLSIVFTAITAFLVQCFFVHRVWRLGSKQKRLYLVIPLMLIVLVELGITIAYVVKGLILVSFSRLGDLRALSISINVLAAVGDVAIAVCLCTILHYSRTGFERSNILINRLIAVSLNTGLLTSVCALCSLITFFAVPNTFVYMVFYIIIGRLYTNSLLGTLNARKRIRDGASGGEDISLSFRETGAATYPSHRATMNNITVRIDTTKDTQHDYSPADDESAHGKRPLDAV